MTFSRKQWLPKNLNETPQNHDLGRKFACHFYKQLNMTGSHSTLRALNYKNLGKIKSKPLTSFVYKDLPH